MGKKVAYTNAVILDGTLDMVPFEGTLLVDGETIQHVVRGAASPEDLRAFEVVDLKGAFIAPGLINMHVHLAGNGRPSSKQRDNEALVKKILSTRATRAVAFRLVAEFAKLELMSGVTTIRTVGGLSNFDSRCRDETAAGKLKGPRILCSNEGISVPGGHMAGSVAVAAKSDDDAVALVNRAHSQGVDLVKLMITGGVMDATEKGVPGVLKMPPSMVKAACDRAHELGLKVAAHVEGAEGMKVALTNGVDSIEHGAKPNDETMGLFKAHDAFLTTTISPALPYALLDPEVSNVSETVQFNGKVVMDGIISCSKSALENGVPVALGNDVGCPYVTQYDFWRELVYFTHFTGVSNSFALHTATQINARLAGIGHVTGTLEASKAADFIVLDSNPLDDLKVLRSPKAVCANGRYFAKPLVLRKAAVDRILDRFL